MSVRENMELYGFHGPAEYVHILKEQYGAVEHPAQADALIMEGLPFYAPQRSSDHFSILSFGNLPLPDSLLTALTDHPEVFPADVRIRWTQEQELLLEATLR